MPERYRKFYSSIKQSDLISVKLTGSSVVAGYCIGQNGNRAFSSKGFVGVTTESRSVGESVSLVGREGSIALAQVWNYGLGSPVKGDSLKVETLVGLYMAKSTIANELCVAIALETPVGMSTGDTAVIPVRIHYHRK
jgi:hypothetical protein